MHVPFRYVLWTEVTDTGRGTAVPLIKKNADNKSISAHEQNGMRHSLP